MRVVIQRVTEASVTVNSEIIGAIGKGVMILVGFQENDSDEDIEWLSNKIINLRIFDDAEGVMNLSVKDIDGEILIVSQFTLMASTKKGNRPSYIKAAHPDISIPLYEKFKKNITNCLGKSVQCGIFGAEMSAALVNDGPVTIIIDTKNRE